jgi:hypothetical protein
MRKKLKRVKIEIIGLVLILVAACWQIFFEDWATKELFYSELLNIQERLLYIWNAIGSEDVIENTREFDTEFWYLADDATAWKRLELSLTYIRAFIFVVGSVLLIIGKNRELNSTQKNKNTLENIS